MNHNDLVGEQNWELKDLESIVWFQEGPGVRKHQYKNNGIKLVNVANLQNGNLDLSTSERYISVEEASGKYKHFLVDEGDLLIASSGIIVDYLDKKMGFVKREHLPLCMNTSVIRFKVLDDSELDLRYLMYYLKTKYYKYQISKLITGSAQLNYGPSHLKKIKLPLPPLPVQDKIVQVLDKAQEMIDLRVKQIKMLDELVQSVFYDMFGDPVTNPKGWEVGAFLNGVEDIIAGHSVNGTARKKEKGELAVLKISAVTSGDFNDKEYKVIENSIAKKNARKYVYPQKGDLLFSRANTRELVAACCIVRKNYDELFLPDKLWRIVTNSKVLNNEYLNKLLSDRKFRLSITCKATGTSGSMLNISQKKLKDTLLLYPPISLQNEFASKVQAIETQKQQMQASLDEMKNNYNSLMQRAFRGDLFI